MRVVLILRETGSKSPCRWFAPVGIYNIVDIRATHKTIEILRGGKRIASHSRIHPDNRHGYNTIPEHMPESHRFQAEWTPERLIEWAEKIGPSTAGCINVLLNRRQHPQQSFRLCLGILKFADKYSKNTMERACSLAKERHRYSYKDFKILIENLPPDTEEEETSIPSHQNIRGKEYYKKVVNGGAPDAD